MRMLLPYILSLLLMFLGMTVYAQGDRIDSALDTYEVICDRCILLRNKSLNGVQIAPEELKSLLEQVSELRSTLQKGSKNMSPAQRDRFERIRRRYTVAFSGNAYPQTDGPALKVQRPVLDLPKVAWKPESKVSGPLTSSGTGMIRAVAEPVEPQGPEIGILALGGWRPGCISYGGMSTLAGERFGVYLKGRSNFKQARADYICTSDGYSDGHIIWTSGNESRSCWALGAGGIVHIAGPVSIYAGSGYGSDEVLWEDSSGKWAKVDDYSFRALSD